MQTGMSKCVGCSTGNGIERYENQIINTAPQRFWKYFNGTRSKKYFGCRAFEYSRQVSDYRWNLIAKEKRLRLHAYKKNQESKPLRQELRVMDEWRIRGRFITPDKYPDYLQYRKKIVETIIKIDVEYNQIVADTEELAREIVTIKQFNDSCFNLACELEQPYSRFVLCDVCYEKLVKAINEWCDVDETEQTLSEMKETINAKRKDRNNRRAA